MNLATPEDCVRRDFENKRRDIEALAKIMLKLMEPGSLAKRAGAPSGWSRAAKDFQKSIKSLSTAQLAEVCYIRSSTVQGHTN
jgi:hypothetical protein